MSVENHATLHLLLTELARAGYLVLMPMHALPSGKPQKAGVPDRSPLKPLPLIWSTILQAMADGKHRTAREIAARGGYAMAGHLRSSLTAMVRAGLLGHDDRGYYRNRSPEATPCRVPFRSSCPDRR